MPSYGCSLTAPPPRQTLTCSLPARSSCRGDRRSLRDKLLESWDGKTYYERLLQMSSQERELAGAGRAAQPAAAKQPHKPGAAGGSAAKTPGRAPAAKATPPVAAARPAAAAPKPAPAPLEVPAASSSAAAKALLTPNTQRRKLNELTGQLQLLKVSTRNRGTLQQAAAAGGVQRSGTPPLEAAAPLAPASAASKTPRSRSRSGSPEAEAQPAAVTAPSAQASAEPAAAAAKAGSKRGSRRGASPPTEASAAAAGSSGDEQEGRATTAAGQKGSSAELAAAYDLLNAALADKDGLAQQLAAVQAELAAERVARAAEQRELAQAREELAQAQAERKVRAAVPAR